MTRHVTAATRHVTASRLGEPGFVLFLHKVYRAGVLSQSELLGWIRLHGAVLRMGPPLQDEGRFDEEAFRQLREELGSEA